MPGSIRAAGRGETHGLVWVPGPVVVQRESLLRGRDAITRPNTVGLCEAHSGQYERRLESLSYPTLNCPHRVMTTTTSDDSRSDSVRLDRTPEELLRNVRMLCHIKGWDEKPDPEPLDRHGVFTTGSATVFEGNPNATALPLPALIAEILSEPTALYLEIPPRRGSFVVKALPVYGALGKNQLDDPEVFCYPPGHHAVFPVNMRYLDGPNIMPKVRSAIRPISRSRLDENRTCETLTTIGGDTTPDGAVEELTGASFAPASYIEHGQHLNRPTRKNTALFIVNPDHPHIRSDSAFHGEPLGCRELIGLGVPRGGLLHPPCEVYVGIKGGVESSLPHDPGTKPGPSRSRGLPLRRGSPPRERGADPRERGTFPHRPSLCRGTLPGDTGEGTGHGAARGPCSPT